MKKNLMAKTISVFAAAVLTMGALAGCGKVADEVHAAEITDTVIIDEDVAKADTIPTESFFTKGVYVNYAEGAVTRDYFYVFYNEIAGYTEDGNNGMGVPFCCEQETGKVVFTFGGEGEEPQVFTVESVEYGVMKGHFDDGITLYFEPVFDADHENFDAVAFVDQHGRVDYQQYDDPNGWSVTYNAAYINVMQQDDEVFFVYSGDGAGTNVIEAYYEPVFGAKDVVDATAKSWGGENTIQTESTFPGTDNVTGYWAILPSGDEGSGLYETIIARDYKNGCLVFETTGHNTDDDELDMQVSDNLAMIIDSITFC